MLYLTCLTSLVRLLATSWSQINVDYAFLFYGAETNPPM